MRLKTFAASVCLAAAITTTSLAGVMENPPAPQPEPEPTPMQSVNSSESADASKPDASITSEIIAAFAPSLIPLIF